MALKLLPRNRTFPANCRASKAGIPNPLRPIRLLSQHLHVRSYEIVRSIPLLIFLFLFLLFPSYVYYTKSVFLCMKRRAIHSFSLYAYYTESIRACKVFLSHISHIPTTITVISSAGSLPVHARTCSRI